MKSSTKKSTVTRIRPNRLPRGISAAEWDARCELAAAYRLAAALGWSDFLGTHFSLRVPGHEDQFLLNPYGMLFEEITASSLIKVDTEGNQLSESPYEVMGRAVAQARPRRPGLPLLSWIRDARYEIRDIPHRASRITSC